MIKSARTKANGELAVRAMSKKAREGYNAIEPLAIYMDGDIETGQDVYSIEGAAANMENLTREQVEKWLEDIVDFLRESEG